MIRIGKSLPLMFSLRQVRPVWQSSQTCLTDSCSASVPLLGGSLWLGMSALILPGGGGPSLICTCTLHVYLPEDTIAIANIHVLSYHGNQLRIWLYNIQKCIS